MLVLFVRTHRTIPVGAAAAEPAVFFIASVLMFLVRASRATAIRRRVAKDAFVGHVLIPS